MVADTTHPAAKVTDKAPDPAPTNGDAATSLSQQATKPGDHGALASVNKGGSSASGLPEVHLTDKGAPGPAPAAPERPAALDQKTIENTARELHDAVTRTSWMGLKNDPDLDKINQLMAPLGQADRKALENAYHDIYDKNGPPGTLRHDLKAHLSEYDFRHSECTLNTKDGTTNDAGALMTALTHAKTDSERGSAEVRAVLENLNSKQLEKLNADFKQQFGKSYLDALKDSKDLTKATQDSLPYLEKGVDKRSADDLVHVAGIAIDNQDRRLFAEAVRGDSPQAAEARQRILNDKDLKAKLSQSFPSDEAQDAGYRASQNMPFEKALDPVALDYLKEGRIELSTIASANTGQWILDNKSNIELAAKNATGTERQDFTKGQELALAGKQPANPEEKRELDFYNKIHSAFKAGGNERETSIWEDQLIHGRETLVSEMAKTHSDGWSPLHFGAGHDQNQLMGKVENLSKEDWKLLQGPDGTKFKKEIEASLNTYAPEDRTRVMQMLDEKARAKTYEEAQKIHRCFSDTVKDSKGSVLWGMGTTYDGKTLVNNILNMSPKDAADYKTNPEFKHTVDQLIKDNFDDTQKSLAAHLLNEVSQTGKPPKPDAVDNVLNDSIQGRQDCQTLADAEKALQDPALRQAMSKPDNQLTEEQKQFKQTVQWAVYGALTPGPAPAEGMSYTPNVDTDKYTKALFETGRVPADLKADLGYPKDQVLTSVAAAPTSERDAAMKSLSADEQAIVKGIRQNPDAKPDLADRIRMMAEGAGGSPADFKDDLSKLSFNDRQKLKDEYTKKYGKDVDQDFLNKVDAGEKDSYANLLRPAATDGRQNYYDSYHRMLRSESGFSPDGSKLTLERANDMYEQGLEEYHKVYKTLPPEKQQALDQYFNQALDQYKGSKEKLAEIVVDATITATALAAAPFTGGASLAAVVAMSAAAGAAFRVTAMKAIEGNDFDGSAKNITKQLIIGGSTAAINFIGAEVLTGAGQLARGVSEQALAGVAMAGGRDALTQGGREILEKGLPKLIQKAGKDVSQQEVAALVSKAAPAATGAEKEALAKGIKDTIASTYDQTQAKITEQIARRTTKATLQHLGKEALANGAVASGANVASEIMVAPFNEHGVDWNALKNGGLQGAVIGAVLPVAFKGLIHAAGSCGEMVTNLTKRADGLYVDPKNITEPITLRNTATNEVRTIEPGHGDALKLTNDWQPESGGRPVKSSDKLRDASGKPVENPKAGAKPVENPRDGSKPNEHQHARESGDGGAQAPDAADHTAGQEPSAKAVDQSNQFATNHEVKEPLEDGFTYASANRQFDRLGKPTTGSDPSFVVDKKELAPLIADAKSRFMSLPPEERAEALSKYVHEKFNPPGMSQQDINKWYTSYLEAHPGQKLTLGQFLKEGKGVCTQEAVTLKVLGDELGLKPTLVRGNGLDGGDDINHAWTTFDFGDGPRVFDPRQGINNVPAEQVATHKPGSDIVAGRGNTDSGAGTGAATNQYRYDGVDGWKIDAHNGDGTVNISRPGIESVKPGEALADFQSLNHDQLIKDGGLKVGQQYKMRRADGSIDDSFKLDGIEQDGSLRVSSDHAIHEENVHPEKLGGAKPELASSAEDLKRSLSKKDLSFDDFYLNAVENTAFRKDPDVKAIVKARLSEEIFKNQDILGEAQLKELKDLATKFSDESDYTGLMTKRLTREFQDNPKVFSDPALLDKAKDLMRELTPKDKSIDPALEAGLLAGINKALGQVENGDINLASLRDIARQSGSTKIQNAVNYYANTGTICERTMNSKNVLTPEQITKLFNVEKALAKMPDKVELKDFNAALKPYQLRAEDVGRAQHNFGVVDTSRTVTDGRTGKLIHPVILNMSPDAGRNAAGEPVEKLGVSIEHGKKVSGEPIGREYQRDVWETLAAQYASGVRP